MPPPATARARSSYLDLPAGWERVRSAGPWPFVTAERLRRPDGTVVEWSSRAHRKAARVASERTGVWWRPDRLSWWIGVLFAIGSTCFLVAAVASQWGAAADPAAIGVTYFVGSIFFTSAAYGQYWQAVNVPHGPLTGSLRRRLRPVSWEPKRIDWLSAVIQFAGTLAFNVSTFEAMKKGLDTRQTNLRVWAPDAVGSVCFLLSTVLAYAEVCRRWICFRRRSLSWWIVALNLAGSIAFGASAIGALIEPSDAEPVNAALANAGTALGALGFLIAAVLLLPEAARQQPAAPPRSQPPSARTPAGRPAGGPAAPP